MKLTYDAEADAAYLYLTAGAKPGQAAKTWPGEGCADGVNLDFDAKGRLLGIEILEASRRLAPELLRGK